MSSAVPLIGGMLGLLLGETKQSGRRPGGSSLAAKAGGAGARSPLKLARRKKEGGREAGREEGERERGGGGGREGGRE